MAKVTMTLNQIRSFGPCKPGWERLLKALGKTQADDDPIDLAFIVESNGIRDAIWCMRVNWFEHKELYMKFVSWCNNRTQGYANAASYTANAAAYASYADDAADAACAAACAANAAARVITTATVERRLLQLLAEQE